MGDLSEQPEVQQAAQPVWPRGRVLALGLPESPWSHPGAPSTLPGPAGGQRRGLTVRVAAPTGRSVRVY